MRIGVLHHPKIPESQSLAGEILTWLEEHSVQAWEASSWDPSEVTRLLPGSDLLVTLGGDGTLLRAGRSAAGEQIPILGINLGSLGFLAEVPPERWRRALTQVLGGDYWIEKRLMLRVQTWRNGQPVQSRMEALNEVVVGRSSMARVVRISAYVDDSYLATYVADGVIVSTATGSTAYSLAAGGPILPPELRNILLLPIAAHLSFSRPLVLDEGATVTLHLRTDHAAILTVDGQFLFDLQDGDKVTVTSSPHAACFVRLQPHSYFYRSLMERLRRTM